MQSLFIALSMYSKIPVPGVEWNEKNMKYALCFFPVVGVIIGTVQYLFFMLCNMTGLGNFFKSLIAAVIPVVITGGIHMDGYLDTVDAICSYADKDKRLEILKDPDSGAFAIIYGIVYFICCVACFSELDNVAVIFVCMGYAISRTLSALSIAAFPKAKNTGLVAAFQDGAHRRNVTVIMCIYIIAEFIITLITGGAAAAIIMFITAGVAFLIHYRLCMSKFGGITGDLAGFFLQICELMILAGFMIFFKF